jgi:hypothetical protein
MGTRCRAPQTELARLSPRKAVVIRLARAPAIGAASKEQVIGATEPVCLCGLSGRRRAETTRRHCRRPCPRYTGGDLLRCPRTCWWQSLSAMKGCGQVRPGVSWQLRQCTIGSTKTITPCRSYPAPEHATPPAICRDTGFCPGRHISCPCRAAHSQPAIACTGTTMTGARNTGARWIGRSCHSPGPGWNAGSHTSGE